MAIYSSLGRHLKVLDTSQALAPRLRAMLTQDSAQRLALVRTRGKWKQNSSQIHQWALPSSFESSSRDVSRRSRPLRRRQAGYGRALFVRAIAKVCWRHLKVRAPMPTLYNG